MTGLLVHPRRPIAPAPVAIRPGSAARLLAVVLVVLHLAPVNVIPRAISGVVVVGCLVLIAVAFWRDQRSMRVPAGAAMLAGAYLTALLMLPLHGQLSLLVQAVAFGGLALAVLVLVAGDRDLDHRAVLRSMLLIGLLQAGLAVVQAATSSVPTWGLLGDRTSASVSSNPLWAGAGGRVVGTMAHPIPLAMLLVTCILLVACRPDLVRRWQRIPLVAVLLLGLVLTGTRSAVVALAVGVVTVLAMRGRRSRWFWRLTLTGAATWLVLRGDVLGWVDSTVGTGFSLTHRVSSLEAVPRLLARRPLEALLGSGYGGADDLYARGVLINDGQMAVDNQFVTFLADAGIVGLVLFVAFLVWLTRRTPAALKPVLAAHLVMLLFFDAVSWPASWASVLVLAAWSPTGRHTTTAQPEQRESTDDRHR